MGFDLFRFCLLEVILLQTFVIEFLCFHFFWVKQLTFNILKFNFSRNSPIVFHTGYNISKKAGSEKKSDERLVFKISNTTSKYN